MSNKTTKNSSQNQALIICYSYHHHNTEKIAKVFANKLKAPLKTPLQIKPEEIEQYSLIGFGSGIYSAKHHKSILDFVDRIPPVSNKKAFVFSTDGSPRFFTKYDSSLEKKQMKKNHQILNNKLKEKGFKIIGEFNCAGFNTNSFLKFFGGINKRRPNSDDLEKAKKFAYSLKEYR